MRLLHARHDHGHQPTCSATTRIPTDAEIRDGLEGNLCRCTGYENIVRAVKRAAEAGATS